MTVEEIARRDGMYWGDSVAATYFRNAEADFDHHWKSIIFPALGDRTYNVVVDLAAGRGRNSVRLAQYAQRVICVDINQDNIRHLKHRFGGDSRFEVVLTDGISLRGIASNSVDLVYSFDSMVHFDLRVVSAYLDECRRVLRIGGHALIHFSNFTDNPGGDFRANPHWRNFMGIDLFTHLARSAGLTITSMRTLNWGNVANLDGLALLQS
jgi:ubiquinone/menaquinone biosynthesis C-methylase UbiE